MPGWKREILKRLAALKLSPAREEEIAEELAQHLEDRYREVLSGGASETEARRQSLAELSEEKILAQELRRVVHTMAHEPIIPGTREKKNMLADLGRDLRYGLRTLARSPGFTLVAALSLALGVGANSTIFSVINTVLYRPLPFEHPERLMVIWATDPTHPDEKLQPPIAESVDWKKQNHVFEDIALTSFTEGETASGLGEPEPIQVQNVTPNFFNLLGVRPARGRIFLAEEMQDQSLAVVISDPFWKSHFNSDPKALGKTFRIGGVVSTVVGVMPPGFAPFRGGRIDLWMPINPESARYSERIDHWLIPVARLKAGVTREQAQTEMDVIARRLEQAYPETNKGVGKQIAPLHEVLFGWAGRTLYPLLGAVGFVLLVACTNVANLFLARTQTRRKEFAVRAALGAARNRLIRQLLIESGLLALLGASFGILLAVFGIRLFRLMAQGFPNAEAISIDGRVLLFTLGIALLTGLLFGLAPAIQASRPDLIVSLKEGDRRTTAGSRGLTRKLLVISEVALALVLLVGAGLMINTMLRLQQVNPGFDATNVLTMRIQLPEGGKYLERVPGGDMEKALPTTTNFYRQLLEKTAALPEVESVGTVGFIMGSYGRSFSILRQPAPSSDQRPETSYTEASPGFFHTLPVPLKKGRYLDEHDTETTPWVAVVNETFARRYFPKQDPIGQQILMRYEPYHLDEERPRQIVGIIGDVKSDGLGRPTPPFVYASYLQQPAVFPGGTVMAHLNQNLVIRVAGGLHARDAGLTAAVKKVVADLDPDQPVTDVMSMDQLLSESITDPKIYMQLFGIFAGMALALAAVGIYGVMAYFVTERTHEIGVRVALGAQRAQVLAMVVQEGLKLTLIGVAAGVAMAFGLTRLIASFLFGVKPTDPVTFAAVSLVLTCVALLACYLPAHRATKVDPMVALRYE
ncbi:MAG TPA: ABC transporter permease [Terriglobia bacterium]|nr:ABC transporter permease [Terriglobia bacterium]